MTSAELKQLIDAAIEGDISDADFLRLEASLAIDPAAREEYYNRVRLSLLLESEALALPTPAPTPIPEANASRRTIGRWHWAFAGMATICGLLILVVIGQWAGPSGNSITDTQAGRRTNIRDAEEEQESAGFAIISGQADALWGNSSVLATGSIVPPGELHLASGLVQFELFSGVTLVVEGDARFTILSPMEVSVIRGKVRARVPEPAHGFRLLTDVGEVVDLGTEFAVNVTGESSEVHVLEGEIEWHPSGAPSQLLEQGRATRISNRGQTAIAARAADFVGPQELQQRLHAWQQSQFEEWKLESHSLSEDPRLIAHYQLSPESVALRRLPNLASASPVLASEGAVVAASPVTSRWRQPESALDFSPAGSRVRVHVPGEFQNLTLVCWVRINSLDRWYNSLFLTDGHEQGEPHWQIMDDGRLFFSVKKNDVWDASRGEKDKHIFYSPSFWTSSLSGRWLMLATVYDGTKGQVTHYLNGEVLSKESIPEEYLVTQIRIGDASMCNWGLPERDQPRFAIRNLNGSLDEFLMFQEPLTDEEIHHLYEIGNP